ncbi:hypothetical protein Poli38472_009233 [Pythium oligandrum]|uniref:J domain-containing protein n=1 Tax=Pythium oligandrum TaxID=41045 RepID=A0A8K1CLU8_PYTOL|nr:hypothetical protein Poli38472_009233 [Pythium oligandrum]|eukprot:TMW65066.1 hypothetical protein Poli38472_009233 [Pythium oligandrum]
MGSTAELIWKQFGKKCDLYEVLGVAKGASGKDITKAYRKMALRYHPDKQRGDEDAKVAATAKFQAISAIHSILSDAGSRAVYDETGSIAPSDDLDDSPSFDMWVAYFAKLFPKVTEADITKFEKEYRFSDEERRDVIDAYVKLEGSMQDILDSIMLSTEDDEDRFVEMIQDAIKNDKKVKALPKWREYLKKRAAKPKKKETEAQKKKRQAKTDKEAQEAEELMNAIRNNQNQRASGSGSLALSTKSERNFSSLISSLESKYTDQPKSKKSKRSRADMDEPSEEAFQAAQERLLKKKRRS